MKTVAQCTLLVMIASFCALLIFYWGEKRAAGSPVSKAPDWGTVSEGFRARAELPQPVVTVGQLGKLRLTIQNTAAAPLLLAESYPEHDYSLTVTDARGELIAPTADASSVWKRILRRVEPGEEIADEYDLKKMYDLPGVGDYSIGAKRRVFRLDGEGTADVESNTVVLTVCEDSDTAKASPPIRGEGSEPGIVAKAFKPTRIPALVAVRPILERHGFRVTWNPRAQRLTATKGKLAATIETGKDAIFLAGAKVELTQPAMLVNGQLCAPGQAISQITTFAADRMAKGPTALRPD
jgi:hypothetical protein